MKQNKKPKKWKCYPGDEAFKHDLATVHDWAGNPESINGTYDVIYRRCRRCGEVVWRLDNELKP